jgi:ketosteroid isomerase-like protein
MLLSFGLRPAGPRGAKSMIDSERNIETVRSYIKALQDGEAGDSLRRFFTQDVRQIEMPNQLNPRGQESDLEHILQRSLQGKQLLKWQSFEIVSEIAHEDRVALESRWTGVLAVTVGKLAAGAEMKASFAMFFRLRDGLIAMQKNYDCFEPW